MESNGLTLHDKVTLPKGFKAAGLRAGIKKGENKDMALLVSNTPAAIAGVFTTNQVQAATVKLCRERLQGRPARAVIINSGNANACTGKQGLRDATRMGQLTAERLGVREDEVFVCSTGHIGVPLPMDLVEAGIGKAVESASPSGGLDAAEAIMTTDTRPKYCTATFIIDGQDVTLTGLAKGAGMVEPNMATMLAYLVTDAAVEAADLQQCLVQSANASFNRITVDGDRSTNDTVLFLANGAAGNAALNATRPEWAVFCEAVEAVTHNLAMKIMRDGEGVTKVVTIEVKGAASDEDADIAARSVGNSLLVKTSWAGTFPNWGRVMDALGYSRAQVDQDQIDIRYDGVPATLNGCAAETPLDELKDILAQERFTLAIDLHLGDGEAVVYSCDCTEEYVRINM